MAPGPLIRWLARLVATLRSSIPQHRSWRRCMAARPPSRPAAGAEELPDLSGAGELRFSRAHRARRRLTDRHGLAVGAAACPRRRRHAVKGVHARLRAGLLQSVRVAPEVLPEQGTGGRHDRVIGRGYTGRSVRSLDYFVGKGSAEEAIGESPGEGKLLPVLRQRSGRDLRGARVQNNNKSPS